MMNNTVNVSTPGGQYPIHISPGRLDRIHESVPGDATSLVIVTNPTVDNLFGDRVRQALASTGKSVTTVCVPDGEQYKDWQTLNLIFDHMLGHQLDRRTVIVALGGGVVGDMAGFAAAVICGGCVLFKCPPRCWHKWTPQWAVKQRSITR